MIDDYPFKPVRYLFIIFCCATCYIKGGAQNIAIENQKFVFFPHSQTQKWTTSVGAIATTFPYDVTEEFHARVPAADVHVVRKLNKHFNIDGRASIQVLQNLVTAGPQWTTNISNRVSIGAGDYIGYWFGFVNFAGFRSKGSGWQNYPHVAAGYRFNKQVLLTLKAEAMMDFGIKTYAGKERVTTEHRLFSGSSYTIAVEQPFYGKRNLILGFRAMYTDFYWQTWPLFESFDRNSFYPQVIIGVIL